MTATIALPRQPHSDWLARIRTIGLGLGGRGVMGLGLGRSSVQAAAAVPWWLAGGAPAPVAAYQPKGAASLAASYVNLANPGMYDVVGGAAYPSWSAGVGWSFSAASHQHLNTGITSRLYGWTMMCQFANASYYSHFGDGDVLMGKYQYRQAFYLAPTLTSSLTRWQSGGSSYNISNITTGGNMALAGQKAYLNGNLQATITTDWGNTAQAGSVLIGAFNIISTPSNWFQGDIIAAALWSTALSDAQVAAVSAAMAAL